MAVRVFDLNIAMILASFRCIKEILTQGRKLLKNSDLGYFGLLSLLGLNPTSSSYCTVLPGLAVFVLREL